MGERPARPMGPEQRIIIEEVREEMKPKVPPVAGHMYVCEVVVLGGEEEAALAVLENFKAFLPGPVAYYVE